MSRRLVQGRDAVSDVQLELSDVLRAVDGVSIAITKGEIYGLVGESGSGKSTIARLIAGLNDLSGGTLTFDGEPLKGKDRPRSLRQRIQMVFQDPFSSLDPRMSVRQQIAELLKVHHAVDRDQVEETCLNLLTQVHLPASLLQARPRQMSGGQRQRVAIARALALKPELLIADEPVSALDVSVQAGIVHLFAELRRELGLTIFFIAHDLAVVRNLCDRVAVMYMGKIVEEGTTNEIFTNPSHPYTRALLQSIPRLKPDLTELNAAPAGDPPSLARLPSGCRFRSRCPYATTRCEESEPSLLVVNEVDPGSNHRAACHYANELKGRVEFRSHSQ
jgi:oligopeptide/dipeptide ABC transporter ATP-binding protein